MPNYKFHLVRDLCCVCGVKGSKAQLWQLSEMYIKCSSHTPLCQCCALLWCKGEVFAFHSATAQCRLILISKHSDTRPGLLPVRHLTPAQYWYSGQPLSPLLLTAGARWEADSWPVPLHRSSVCCLYLRVSECVGWVQHCRVFVVALLSVVSRRRLADVSNLQWCSFSTDVDWLKSQRSTMIT